MSFREVNFDGLVGPTHNYAGLSLGNVASATNAGDVSHPRQAALQGLGKMKRLMDLGLLQGFLPPLFRPDAQLLRALGFKGSDDQVLKAALDEDPELFRRAFSASAMWTANAATVIAAPDSGDGRTHLVTANLATMMHRAFEAEQTYARLKTVFADELFFAVHPPLPHGRHFSDEGAANHMRLSAGHGERGMNVFVHGQEDRAGRYPERQSRRASEAVARLAGLGADTAILARQSQAAIDAGAFHNDVVAVANETLLLAHPDAYDDKERLYEALERRIPRLRVFETRGVSLEDAVACYLFNSQLVTLPEGGMALVLPVESRARLSVWSEVDRMLSEGVVQDVIVADVRESMRNGGGPACLRLRVPVSEQARAAIDPRFLLDERKWEALARLVERAWPETIAPSDLADPALWAQARAAHAELSATIDALA
ncbi:MAG TPA: N-succinylarginine dihydrolase [Caulobacteraceae bacterium]